MTAERKATFWTILFAVALAGCSKNSPVETLGGPPGGPIIVITPDPEPTATPLPPPQKYQCYPGYEPCWYAGVVSSSNFGSLPTHAVGIDDVGAPSLPSGLLSGAVEGIWVKQKQFDYYIQISSLTLGLQTGGTVDITVTTLNKPPVWRWNGGYFKSAPRPAYALPKALLSKFTAVTVVERDGQNLPAHDPTDLSNLKEVRIFYRQ